MTQESLLRVQNLSVDYVSVGGRDEPTRAVSDVSFEVFPGESIALIGESGSGKTTLALALLRLLPRLGRVAEGSVVYRHRDGQSIDLLTLPDRAFRQFRWAEAAMVFQGAMNSFNPVLTIWDHMVDTVRAHRPRATRTEIRERSAHVLHEVELEPGRVLPAYPHQLSGGMRQRVLIAMALLLEPQLLVLDEPTTALDILTQRRIVDLIYDLHERLDFAMIFVSHDLAVAAELAHRVATMYDGSIVEMDDVREIFYRPQHPYTRQLIGSVPTVTSDSAVAREVGSDA